MHDDEVRERARAAGERFQQTYVMVAIPKTSVPLLKPSFDSIGLELKVVDDGEDDGLMALVALPNAKVLDAVIADYQSAFLFAMWMFVMAAALVVVTEALHGSGFLVAWFSVLMSYAMVRALAVHKQLQRRRHAQQRLRDAGL